MDTGFHFAPPRASVHAAAVDAILLYLVIVTIFFTVLIAVLVIYFSIRYRRRTAAFSAGEAAGLPVPPAASIPESLSGRSRVAMWLEITWIGIPLILVIIMFLAGKEEFLRQSQPPPGAMQINIVGKQWMWKIQHPSGAREIDELHIPIGRPIKLIMTSQDVIHDFWIPAFSVKQDVVPGRYTQEWFQATKPGEYHIFCAQYCGTNHAAMIGKVVAMEEAEYQAWLAGAPIEESPRAAGEKLFAQYGCISCHGSRAPSLAGVYGHPQPIYEDGTLKTVVADDNYLRESILFPAAKVVAGYPPIMPSFRGQLTEEQIMQLIAYIKSLEGALAPSGPPGDGSPATQPSRAVPGPGPFLPTESNK